MKKERNTFFSEAQSSSYNYYPNQFTNMNMMPSMPTQASQSSQSFYAGPAPINGYNNYSDIESRIAKIERQISRLDNRVTKLENLGDSSEYEIDEKTNMYMI